METSIFLCMNNRRKSITHSIIAMVIDSGIIIVVIFINIGICVYATNSNNSLLFRTYCQSIIVYILFYSKNKLFAYLLPA